MKTMLRTAVQALIDRLPWDELILVLRRIAERRLPTALLDRIEVLVRQAEATPGPGPDKLRWVLAKLTAADSPVRHAALAVAGHLLHWAVESAVLRLKSRAGA